MQIQKVINLKVLISLTILNICFAAYSFGAQHYVAVVLFFVGVLLNQAMLFAGLKNLLVNKKKSFTTALLLVGKFLVLAVTFILTLRFFPNKLPTLVFCYTFQLIILTLSIKRKTAKN